MAPAPTDTVTSNLLKLRATYHNQRETACGLTGGLIGVSRASSCCCCNAKQSVREDLQITSNGRLLVISCQRRSMDRNQRRSQAICQRGYITSNGRLLVYLPAAAASSSAALGAVITSNLSEKLHITSNERLHCVLTGGCGIILSASHCGCNHKQSVSEDLHVTNSGGMLAFTAVL